MKVVKPSLTSRPTLLGAVGAVALLAMAATATFAAGLPNILPASDPTGTPSHSAVASASDRDDSTSLSPSASATATEEATEKASEEATEGAKAPKASGSPLIGYCNALNGNALQAISEIVKEKGDKDLPPGLQKVYERLLACPSFTPQGGKPTAAPSEEPAEHASSEPSGEPSLPSPVVTTDDHSRPSLPADADGHGRGNGH